PPRDVHPSPTRRSSDRGPLLPIRNHLPKCIPKNLLLKLWAQRAEPGSQFPFKMNMRLINLSVRQHLNPVLRVRAHQRRTSFSTSDRKSTRLNSSHVNIS